MTEKFQWMQERYNELSEAVSQPEIIADTARWQRLLKEHAQLEPAVQAWPPPCGHGAGASAAASAEGSQ